MTNLRDRDNFFRNGPKEGWFKVKRFDRCEIESEAKQNEAFKSPLVSPDNPRQIEV